MVDKGKGYIGPTVGIVGSIFIMIAGLVSVSPSMIYLINAIIGGIGFIGAAIGFTSNKGSSSFTMLIMGILGVIAMFTPIMHAYIFLGPPLLVVGGILGYLFEE